MGASRSSIVARKRNFDFLETGSGSSHAAEQTRAGWSDYIDDPKVVAEQGRMAYEFLVIGSALNYIFPSFELGNHTIQLAEPHHVDCVILRSYADESGGSGVLHPPSSNVSKTRP